MGQNSSNMRRMKSIRPNKPSTIAWLLTKIKHKKRIVASNPTPPIKFQYCQRRKPKKPRQLPNIYPDLYANTKAHEGVASQKSYSYFFQNAYDDNYACPSVYDASVVHKSVINNFNYDQTRPIRPQSEPPATVKRHKHRPRSHSRSKSNHAGKYAQFGYDIDDINDFLNEAHLKNPANIPIVLTKTTTLYSINETEDEITLQLGTVVNAIFKRGDWLYVQTPHAQEGFVLYTAAIPLGIVPKPRPSMRCWESSTDIFPMPSGNMTDSEKLTQSEYGGRKRRRRRRNAVSEYGESNVDRLYLKAVSDKFRRNDQSKTTTLLVAGCDYSSDVVDTLKVSEGDVFSLIGSPIRGWFLVRARDGSRGYIPASIVGNGHY